MSLNKRILVKSNRPPTVEIDPSCNSAYVRFKSNATIAKTISEDKPGVVVTIDLDANGEVVGVELVGVQEFSISAIVKLLPQRAQKADFTKARFVVPDHVSAVPA